MLAGKPPFSLVDNLLILVDNEAMNAVCSFFMLPLYCIFLCWILIGRDESLRLVKRFHFNRLVFTNARDGLQFVGPVLKNETAQSQPSIRINEHDPTCYSQYHHNQRC